MKRKGFCEHKFSSMFISGTFTKAVMYIMLLCDSIIAGYFIGGSGVAAINAITPVIGVPIILYIILNRRRIQYFN